MRVQEIDRLISMIEDVIKEKKSIKVRDKLEDMVHDVEEHLWTAHT